MLSPCHHFKGNRGVDCLDEDSRIVDRRSRDGRFNDSCNIYDCNADGSLIHGYAW